MHVLSSVPSLTFSSSLPLGEVQVEMSHLCLREDWLHQSPSNLSQPSSPVLLLLTLLWQSSAD